MKIIVDANVLMSALMKDSITREFIVKSEHSLFVPETIFGILLKYRKLILKKTNAKAEELDCLTEGLFKYVAVQRRDAYEGGLEQAKIVMSNIDVEDATFVACALGIPDSVIWSNDKHLKKQKLVKVYTTDEIIKIK